MADAFLGESAPNSCWVQRTGSIQNVDNLPTKTERGRCAGVVLAGAEKPNLFISRNRLSE